MKLTKTKKNKGMTLIELTVVILVLLSLISVLFIGARAWLDGSERAQAAILIRNAQQGVRSHSNLFGVDTPSAMGTPIAWPNDAGGGPVGGLNLDVAVFGPGRYVETNADGLVPTHPDSDDTFVAGGTDFRTVPPLEQLYMTSSVRPEFFRPQGVQ